VRKRIPRLPIEEKLRVVLGLLKGEISGPEAARRHGVSVAAVYLWRDKFLDGGRQALEEKVPGPGKGAGTADERRLKLENNQLKLALAEATVQLRIWQKGAEYVEQVPFKTSKP
jgi:transposase